jgi:membrane protein implicated in regulation of membrane protease activity
MHHLILSLPLIGIVVFWLLPLKIAAPSYAGIVLASGLMYWAIIRAIKKIPTTGASGLVGTSARVVSKLGPSDEAQYLVEADGELWSANSPDVLKPGEKVRITKVEGIKLLVSRFGSQQISPSGAAKTNA